MKTSEFLYETADHIATYGHTKKAFYDLPTSTTYSAAKEYQNLSMTAPSCLVGAMGVVKVRNSSEGFVEIGSTENRAIRAVAQNLGLDGSPQVMDWNDEPERTAEDVILTLKTVAHDLEQNGD